MDKKQLLHKTFIIPNGNPFIHFNPILNNNLAYCILYCGAVV